MHCRRLLALDDGYADWSGQMICSSHDPSSATYCLSCRRFCNPSESINLGYGTYLCGICRDDIVNKETASSIVEYIRDGYRKAGLGEISNWHLKVIDVPSMRAKYGDVNVAGFATQTGSLFEVTVLRHLSRVAFANVLAHELLHIWQYNRNLSPESSLSEGFCNMGSYYVLKHIATNEAHAFMEMLERNPDPIYGDGFRRVKSVFDKGGWEEVINLISSK